MKEIIGKSKIRTNPLPKQVTINSRSITQDKDIAEHLNDYFVTAGKSLASKIPGSTKTYDMFLEKSEKSIKLMMYH